MAQVEILFGILLFRDTDVGCVSVYYNIYNIQIFGRTVLYTQLRGKTPLGCILYITDIHLENEAISHRSS